MKLPRYLALFIFCPGLLLAQSDKGNEQDTVYLQGAETSLSEAAYLKSLPTYIYGSPTFIQAQQDIQNYQDSINTVIDANDSAAAPAKEYRRLLVMADRAARTKDMDERKDLFGNFLHDSRLFLHDHPEATRLWVLRAGAALSLNKAATGGEAGRMILSLPAHYRDDARIQRLLGMLSQKGWLPKDQAAPGQPAVEKVSAPAPAPAPAAK